MLFHFQCGNKDTLKSGDILFCSYGTGNLSQAIDEVTRTRKNTHYSHMGLVELTGDSVFIIHATAKRGVVRETIDEFMLKESPSMVDVYRLKEPGEKTIVAGLKRARELVGLPYNTHYRMNDSCYYCSQLVYEAFKPYPIFKLEPMTFKNPGSDAFNEGWIKHYKDLGMAIPEGEPGCNPNGLAASQHIEFVFRLR